MKIKEMSEVLNGYAFKSSNYINEGYRVIRITNVQSGYIEDEKPVYYEFDNKLEKYKLKENDLLISLTGNVGRCALVTKDFLPAYLNQRVCCLRINKEKVIPKFLYYILNSKKFEFDCINSSQGIAQLNMSTEWLKEYNLEIPAIELQKKIINIFDKVYNNINIKKNQINSCNNLIKSQFVEMFENKDFPYVKFKEYMDRCVDVGSNGANATVMKHYNMTDEKDYAIVIRFINLNSGDFEKDIKYINKEDYEFYSKSKVYGNEIIFCKIGSAGMNYIMPKLSMPVTLGLNQIMITPKNINTRYLYEYINSLEGKMYINNNINGAVTKTITKHALWEFPIKTPPIELQNKFANIVEQIDKQKFVNANLLQLLGKNLKRCYNNIVDFR